MYSRAPKELTLLSRLLAEFLGTALLVATVVGSGIMAQSLTADIGLQLLINTLATVFVLFVLITVFGPYSADFNPAVTLALLIEKRRSTREFLIYVPIQLLAGFSGAVLANVMFSNPAIEFSQNQRAGFGIYLSEIVATFGLVFVILMLLKHNQSLIAVSVAAWIGAGYFFTASTSFANPAVSFGRIFTNSFSGIAPESLLGFVLLQLLAAVIAVLVYRLFERKTNV